jgi:integrase
VKAFLTWSENEHQEHPNTYIRYRTSSKLVLAFFKFRGKRLDQITAATIEDYKKHRGRQISRRTKKPITPATINRELALLKAIFFHAQKSDRHILNPVCEVEFLPENNEQNRILSYDEQRRYLAVTSATLKDIARLMLETGMRPEEVCRIQKQNVVLYGDDPYVYVPFGKTKASRRRVPVKNQARLKFSSDA